MSDKPKMVEVNADVLADLVKQVQELKSNQSESQKKHHELNTKMDQFRRGEWGIEASMKRGDQKAQEPPRIVHQPATVDGTMKENICPKCNDRKEANICDISRTGKWACRKCGKNWYDWAIGQPYTLELEQGERDLHFAKLKHTEQLEIARSGQSVA